MKQILTFIVTMVMALAASAMPEVLNSAEVAPQYPGGNAAIQKFVADNCHIMASDLGGKTMCRVTVTVTVDTDGKMTNPRVVRKGNERLDAEALRLVGLMPSLTPAKNGGKAVAVNHTLVLTFNESMASRAMENVTGRSVNNIEAPARQEVKVVEERRAEPQPEPTPKKEEIFKSAEQMPSFPGGDAALTKFLNSHIQYPAEAKNNNIQGRVIVQFVVGKDGSVSQAKVARGVYPALDQEALRVVRSLPKFIPGKQNGQPVAIWYTLPVQFKLPDPEPQPEPKPKKEEIFRSADVMPSFPGGDAALMEFLNANVHYPAAAEENNVQGRVIVQFVVGKDGSARQAKIARGVHPALDNEALRVVRSLPKFIPGKQNGQPVAVWYTLPVQFKLQSSQEPSAAPEAK